MKDIFNSGDPAFSDKVSDFTFEVCCELIFGRDDSFIETLFKNGPRDTLLRLKSMKRKIFKSGKEVNHHYSARLTEKRAEKLGHHCATVDNSDQDFEALSIDGPYEGLAAPVAFESKFVTSAEHISYRVWEYVYRAKAAGFSSCVISLYDALDLIDWAEIQQLETEVAAYLPTKIVNFEPYTGRLIPHPAFQLAKQLFDRGPAPASAGASAPFVDPLRINELNRRIAGQPVSLLVGAGTTVAAGGPSWLELIKRLWLHELRGRQSYAAVGDDTAQQEFNAIIGDSVLLQARALQRMSGPGFIHKVRQMTYRGVNAEAVTPRAVAGLGQRLHGDQRLSRIITFNYDSLLETNLSALGLPSEPRYHQDRQRALTLTVEHVHGYLPPPPHTITPEMAASVVFDEETYHSRFNDPTHWTNRVLIGALTESVCIFVGFSMSDPNVRRLLEQTRMPGQPPHFALLRATSLDVETAEFQVARARLQRTQEQMLGDLGVNVIWYENYDDLPAVLELIGLPAEAPIPALWTSEMEQAK